MVGENLLGIRETLLPEETDVLARLDAGDEAIDLAAKFPSSSLVWALLANEAHAEGRTVDSYAFARVVITVAWIRCERLDGADRAQCLGAMSQTAAFCVRSTRWAVRLQRLVKAKKWIALRSSSTIRIPAQRQLSKPSNN